MKIAVVGVGALGCLLGAYLSDVANIVLIGNWPEQLAAIRRDGLWLTHPDGRRSHHKIPVARYGQPVRNVETALIAVKSRQTKDAAHVATGVLDEGGLAVTLQNGLGNLAELRGILGDKRVAIAVTSEGSSLTGPGEVRHAGHGPTYFGRDPVLGDAQRILLPQVAELFSTAGFDAQMVDDTDGLVWGKLAINAAINPLTALLRVPNGFLVEHGGLVEIMSQAANEVSAVAKAMGVPLPYPDAAERAIGVARATGTNLSSMLQDILRGAPTEIEAISGAITRAGIDVAVPTPVNSRLAQLVRQAEEGNPPLQHAGDITSFYRLMGLVEQG